jgi:hypothetical protein
MSFGLTDAPSTFQADILNFIDLPNAPPTFQTCFTGKGGL